MNGVDNNQFEIKSAKRKIAVPCPNIYLNPALDLLANEDPMINTAMEIVPNKKRKRTKSCDIVAFENTGLDLGVNKAAVNEFLVREIDNVRRNFKYDKPDTTVATETSASSSSFKCPDRNTLDIVNDTVISNNTKENLTKDVNSINNDTAVESEPIYANVNNLEPRTADPESTDITCSDISRIPHEDFDIDSGISVLEQKLLNTNASNITNIQTNVTNKVIVNNNSLSLSFIDRLALDSPINSDQSLFLDDDLNESNIMEIKTITIITKTKRVVEKKNTNPFLDPMLNTEDVVTTTNPFLDIKPEIEYNEEATQRPLETQASNVNVLVPRRLFSGDTNSTISTNETSIESQIDYENIDNFRADSPIYENIEEVRSNKQSKILGHDVSQFSAIDIMNLNKNRANNSNESQDSKKDFKQSLLKAGTRLSKKFKTLKKKLKHEKVDTNVTLNPYEVPRKAPKQKEAKKESGIENPALNLDISDDIEIEELDDEEHHYETIKTRRNTELNMNVTPLKARDNEIDFLPNKSNTPGKKVRFDSTLNQEKVITGNSFDYDIQSPGFDSKIEKYHDELENCINERKFLQQNM